MRYNFSICARQIDSPIDTRNTVASVSCENFIWCNESTENTKYARFVLSLSAVLLFAVFTSNASYELPYQTYPFFEIQDRTTYLCFCAYQVIAVPVIVCGYSAPDSFVLSMALHICGQLAVLSYKIEDLLKDHRNYSRHIGTIVIRHHQLITWVRVLHVIMRAHLCTLEKKRNDDTDLVEIRIRGSTFYWFLPIRSILSSRRLIIDQEIDRESYSRLLFRKGELVRSESFHECENFYSSWNCTSGERIIENRSPVNRFVKDAGRTWLKWKVLVVINEMDNDSCRIARWAV